MEDLVMDSEPSLLSILNNIKSWMKATNADTTDVLQKRSEDYYEQMKNYPKRVYQDGIIFQYGAGSMKGGSYDRYTPFRVHPDADFLVLLWPMGLLQASCNPFKKERELKGVNLGQIAQEVLSEYEPALKKRVIPLSTMKWLSEVSVGPDSVGFTFKDFDALFGGKFQMIEGGEEVIDKLKPIMDKPFSELTEQEKSMLDKVGINMWDFIQSQSGGHKCITNISGLMSNKVYTKKGDDGTTSLLSGRRVPKTLQEIKAVGSLDELNSFVGLLRTETHVASIQLEIVQWNLFNAGSTIINDNETELTEISEEDIKNLENAMDLMSSELPPLKNFILPKGNKATSLAHVCRTIARRTEIEVLECKVLDNFIKLHPISKYLNRLSDFFFVMARYIGKNDELEETIWKN